MVSANKPVRAGWFKIPAFQRGKVELARQMRGLDAVRHVCTGASVLDLGCAEGLVSLELAKAGATLIHGVELLGERLVVAEDFFKKELPSLQRKFITWDLTRFDDLVLGADSAPAASDQPTLLSRYDVVLCLAIAQKLSNPRRFLRLASLLCADLMAVRLPYPVLDDPRSFNIRLDVAQMLASEFDLIQETDGYPTDLKRPYAPGDDAWLGIFRRRRPRTG